jgi:aminoglycoside 3-N-acetyltransferase
VEDRAHRERIARDLLAAGVTPGATILVHSSLRALGHVEGGAECVIGGLLDALGKGGTLLMPALSYAGVNADSPRFDVLRTSSNVGAIPETFRRMPGVQRSLHPTHSVCGIGPRASSLLAGHRHDRTPCGPHSPYRLLAGCGGSTTSSTPCMEVFGRRPQPSMKIEPPYLFGAELALTLVRKDGSEIDGAYRMHGFRGYGQRYDRVAELGSGPWLREGRVMEATVHLIDAGELWRRAEAALRRDPLFFVDAVAVADHPGEIPPPGFASRPMDASAQETTAAASSEALTTSPGSSGSLSPG